MRYRPAHGPFRPQVLQAQALSGKLRGIQPMPQPPLEKSPQARPSPYGESKTALSGEPGWSHPLKTTQAHYCFPWDCPYPSPHPFRSSWFGGSGGLRYHPAINWGHLRLTVNTHGRLTHGSKVKEPAPSNHEDAPWFSLEWCPFCGGCLTAESRYARGDYCPRCGFYDAPTPQSTPDPKAEIGAAPPFRVESS